MEYQHLGGGDYLVKIDEDKIERVIETMAEKSYLTAKLKRESFSGDDLVLDDFIVYSSDHTKVIGLNMGLINQRQCYTKLQKMIAGDDFIFRRKYFEKGGRDPEQFLDSIVQEIENK